MKELKKSGGWHERREFEARSGWGEPVLKRPRHTVSGYFYTVVCAQGQEGEKFSSSHYLPFLLHPTCYFLLQDRHMQHPLLPTPHPKDPGILPPSPDLFVFWRQEAE